MRRSETRKSKVALQSAQLLFLTHFMLVLNHLEIK